VRAMRKRGSGSATKEEVLALLRNEIEDAEHDRQRQGWNTWVLAAAVAGVTWVGVGFWETSSLKLAHVAGMLVVGVMLVESLRAAASLLDFVGQSRTPSAKARLLPMQPLTYSRVVLRLVGLLAITVTTASLIGNAPLWAVLLAFAIQFATLVSSIVLLLMSRGGFEVPTAESTSPAIMRVFRWLAVVPALAAAGAIGIAASYRLVSPGTPMPEFKMALIALALWYLVPATIYEAIPSPFLKRLRALRRDLQLRAVEAKQALREVEELLVGKEVGAVLHNHARSLLEAITAVETDVSEARVLLWDARAAKARGDGPGAEAFFSMSQHSVERAGTRNKASVRAWESFERRVEFLGLALSVPMPNIQVVLDDVDWRLQSLTRQVLRLKGAVGELATSPAAAITLIKSDLRDLVTAQEAYFADNRTYTQDVSNLDFIGSRGVEVTVTHATVDGWRATASHEGVPEEYSIYVGTGGGGPQHGVEGEPTLLQ